MNTQDKDAQRPGMTALGKAVEMLQAAERRRALVCVGASLLSAVMASAMILFVVQFLQLLFRPETAESPGWLSLLRRAMGNPDAYDFVVGFGILCAVIALAAFVAQLYQVHRISTFTAGLTHTLGRRLLAGYLYQPYEFALSRHSAGMTANILAEAEQAVGTFYRPVVQLLAGSLTTIAVLAVLSSVNPLAVALATLSVGLPYALSYFLVRARVKTLGEMRAQANQQRYRNASESLQGFKDVKILGRESAYLERFDTPSRTVRDATIAAQALSNIPRFALQSTAVLACIVVCLLLVTEQDYLSNAALGDLAPILGTLAIAAQRLMPEIQRILDSLLRLQYGVASIDALHADLVGDTCPEKKEGARRLRLTNALHLEGLGYHYAGATVPGLHELTLSLPAGGRIGIVGPSGAGKTTLGDMVLGLLTPSRGRMVVDGVEITKANRRDWRRSVGFVPQEIFLMDASIAENIALGLSRDAINMDKVRQCGRLAQIDGFVTETLPQGYDTPVGERGVRLSGGQRQRLAIARALYRDSDLIVFDEATSALDTHTEAEVMAALRALPGATTVLLIAHRLSTLDVCDQIIVLDHGQLVGLGTFADLMETCPTFRKLATRKP